MTSEDIEPYLESLKNQAGYLCWRYWRPELKDDIYHDMIVELLSLEEWKSPGWVMRVARNAGIDALRSKKYHYSYDNKVFVNNISDYEDTIPEFIELRESPKYYAPESFKVYQDHRELYCDEYLNWLELKEIICIWLHCSGYVDREIAPIFGVTRAMVTKRRNKGIRTIQRRGGVKCQ